MKVYMSFWTQDKVLEDYKFIDILKVALYYAKQHYKEIQLITDYKGEELLKNIFNWTSLSTELESLPKEYKDVWSLGKIKAYNLIAEKGDPFLHFDSDVFMIKPLPKNLLNSDIFCQSIEQNCYLSYKIYKFDKYCINKFYPDNINIINHTWSPNCGIVGGTDLDFFKTYSETALRLVLDESNKIFWIKNTLPSHLKSCIAEQYYLGLIASSLNKKVTPFLRLKGLKVLDLEPDTYIHLCSSGKNNKKALDNIQYLNDFIIK